MLVVFLRKIAMKILRLWFNGFVKPTKMIETIKEESNPRIGFQAVFIRSLLNSIFLFLPLHLIGKQPSMESWLSIIDTKNYFLFLTIVTPYVFIVMWLFLSGAIYLLVTIKGRYRFDHILNIFGIVSLVVGSFLVVWDWLWILIGSKNYVLLGYSHLLFDCWAIWLTIICLKKIMDIKYSIGFILNLIWILLSFPIAILIMRAPL